MDSSFQPPSDFYPVNMPQDQGPESFLPSSMGQQLAYRQLGTLFPRPSQLNAQRGFIESVLGLNPKQANEVMKSIGEQLQGQRLLYGQKSQFELSPEEAAIESVRKQMAILEPASTSQIRYRARS